MSKLYILPLIILVFSFQSQAQHNVSKTELKELLHEFMEGASENDPQMHDRFWAEDLIYTSSSGERFGKAEIMAGFNEEDNAEADTESLSVSYSAEDIRIQVYEDMAVVAFRLVGRTETNEGIQTDHYLNSGTFVKRDGQWKVVNWQATRVPE